MITPYTLEERKIHDSIYFFMAQSITNPILKQRILQYATQEIINQIDEITLSLDKLFNGEGLRQDQFELKDICENTKEFLERLIIQCHFSQYRRINK